MASSTPEVALNSDATGKSGGYGVGRKRSTSFSGVDFGLRLLLFASSVSALAVLATSKQTVSIPVILQPQTPPIFVTRTAKFHHSPAFTYLLVALAVTTLYSIITLITTASFLSKSAPSSKVLFRLLVLDLLMVGIMASATGSSASVAYIGLEGNSHVLWNKICNVFGKFCRHVGSATALALVAAIILVLLVFVSSFSIYRRSV